MIERKNINRLNDSLFKYIFAREEHKDSTLDLINAVLAAADMPLITDFTFRDREQSPESAFGKPVAFDIVGDCSDGTKVHVEVQVAPYQDMIPRILYYWSRIFSRTLLKGEEYGTLTKTISMNFLGYLCPELAEMESFHNTYELRNLRHPEHKLTDLCSIHFVEIPKWEQKRRTQGNLDLKTLSRLEKWTCYLSSQTGDQEREELAMIDPALHAALKAEKKFFTDPSEFEVYEKSEESLRLLRAAWNYAVEDGLARGEAMGLAKGFAQGEAKGLAKGFARGEAMGLAKGETMGLAKGRAEGRAEGRVEGEAKGKDLANRETARKLLAMGMSIKDIAAATSLGLEDVQKIAKGE